MIKAIFRYTIGSRDEIRVMYENGQERRFDKNDNIPMSVVSIILNGTCETRYMQDGGRVEKYTK